MKALVTGATGLIGSHVVRALEDGGHEARALVRSSDTRSLHGTAAALVPGDVLDAPALLAAAEGTDVVFHCAALFSYTEPAEEIARVNVDGTRNVLRAAAQAGVRRVVVTTSSVTCGSSALPEPVDETCTIGDEEVPPYYRTKVAQEEAALAAGEELGLEVVVACPTITVGGPDWRLVPSNGLIVRYLLDPTRTTYHGGCDVVAVRDVADGHVLLAERGAPGERYLLGSEGWTWRLIHETISQLCGTTGPFLTASATSAYLAAAAVELAARLGGRPPLSTRAEARTVGRFYWYRHDKAAALGYAPRPTHQALVEAVAWLLTSPHLPRPVREWLHPTAEVAEARVLSPSPLG